MSSADSPELQIVDAVVALLNGPPQGYAFTISATAVAGFAPIYDLTLLQTPKVTVMPGDEEDTFLHRNASQLDVNVDVGIQQKLPPNAATADLISRCLMQYASQIKKLLKLPADVGPLTLADGTRASWIGMTARPLWHEPHLLESRTFTRILTFTYRTKVGR